MEWAIGVPILLLLLVCPLMMGGMIIGGWLLARRGGSHAGHSGHGMMCMGHGGHGDGHAQEKGLVEDLKAERQRLDDLIARAEKAKGD